MAAHRTSIESLSDDVLGKVFMLLPQGDRVRGLPLVCHRWYTIMADTTMWPAVDMTLGIGASGHDRTTYDWLRQRSPGIRELTLQQGGENSYLISALQTVAPMATQLQQLRLVTNDAHPLDIWDLACVSRLHTLTHFEAEYIGTPIDQPALDDVLAQLPALRVVCLHFCPHKPRSASDADSDTDYVMLGRDRMQPDNFPQSLLSCTGLTRFDLSMFKPDNLEDMFAVGSLPADITALQNLQHLRLHNSLTLWLTCSISRMTQLTSLAVTYDDLDSMPYDAPGLPESALPSSLRTLEALSVPREVLAELTALERLNTGEITATGSESTPVSDSIRLHTLRCPSILQGLTWLRLGYAADAELLAFAGCTNLRTLCLRALEAKEVLPLPFEQLTRLQLRGGDYLVSEIQTMIPELPQLEVLEVLDTDEVALELAEFDVVAWSRLPKLRLVNLSGSMLWNSGSVHRPIPAGEVRNFLPLRAVHQLMSLQRSNPNIEWVLGDPTHWL